MAAMDASAGFTSAAVPALVPVPPLAFVSCIIFGDIPIVPIPAGSIDPIPPEDAAGAGSLSLSSREGP